MTVNLCKYGDCALEGEVYGFCSNHFYNYYVKEGRREWAKKLVDAIRVQAPDLIDSSEMNTMFQRWGHKSTINRPCLGEAYINEILEKRGRRALSLEPRCESCLGMGLEVCHCEKEKIDREEARLEEIGKYASRYSIADINILEKIEKDRLQNL